MQIDIRIPLVAALITASAAFLGAVLAQVLSHWFTIRREERKFQREIYERLFAPVIFDAFLFLDASTHFRASDDVIPGSTDKLRDKVVSHVGEHITLASPRLIAAYYDTKRREYIDDDGSGYAYEIADTSFFYTLVDEFARLVRRIGIFERRQRKEVAYYRDLYLIWRIAAQLHHSDANRTLLCYKWLFDRKKMGRRFRRRLEAWDREAHRRGEGWSKLAGQFDAFVIRSLARDEKARDILSDAFR